MSAALRALKLFAVGIVVFVLSRIISLVPLLGIPPIPYIFAGYIGGRAAGNPMAGLGVGIVAAVLQATVSLYALIVLANSTAPAAETATGFVLLQLGIAMVALPLSGLFGGRW